MVVVAAAAADARRPGEKKNKKKNSSGGGGEGQRSRRPHSENEKGDEGSFRAAKKRSWVSLLPVHKRTKRGKKKVSLPSFFPPRDAAIKPRRKRNFSSQINFFFLPPPPFAAAATTQTLPHQVSTSPLTYTSSSPPRPCTPARCIFLGLSRALCERTGESGARNESRRGGGKDEQS